MRKLKYQFCSELPSKCKTNVQKFGKRKSGEKKNNIPKQFLLKLGTCKGLEGSPRGRSSGKSPRGGRSGSDGWWPRPRQRQPNPCKGRRRIWTWAPCPALWTWADAPCSVGRRWSASQSCPHGSSRTRLTSSRLGSPRQLSSSRASWNGPFPLCLLVPPLLAATGSRRKRRNYHQITRTKR